MQAGGKSHAFEEDAHGSIGPCQIDFAGGCYDSFAEPGDAQGRVAVQKACFMTCSTRNVWKTHHGVWTRTLLSNTCNPERVGVAVACPMPSVFLARHPHPKRKADTANSRRWIVG